MMSYIHVVYKNVVFKKMILSLAIKQMRLRRPKVKTNPARRAGRGLPGVVWRAGGLCQSEALYRALTEENNSVPQCIIIRSVQSLSYPE